MRGGNAGTYLVEEKLLLCLVGVAGLHPTDAGRGGHTPEARHGCSVRFQLVEVWRRSAAAKADAVAAGDETNKGVPPSSAVSEGV